MLFWRGNGCDESHFLVLIGVRMREEMILNQRRLRSYWATPGLSLQVLRNVGYAPNVHDCMDLEDDSSSKS